LEIGKDILKAAEIIQKGGLVAFPTETVYGLGANAMDPMAVARIFEIKKRPAFDPLIVHIARLDDLHLLCNHLTEDIYVIIRRFWPGPLTLVLPKNPVVPDIVTAGLHTVAVRMPAHPVAL
jgi:L-threonylcarbamoyladenylate synthase